MQNLGFRNILCFPACSLLPYRWEFYIYYPARTRNLVQMAKVPNFPRKSHRGTEDKINLSPLAIDRMGPPHI